MSSEATQIGEALPRPSESSGASKAPLGHERTAFGAVPLGWSKAEIGDLLLSIRNGAVYVPEVVDGVAITRIETISSGCIEMSHAGRARYTEELASYKMQQGDILYSHINSLKHIGKVAFFAGGTDLYPSVPVWVLPVFSSLFRRADGMLVA